MLHLPLQHVHLMLDSNCAWSSISVFMCLCRHTMRRTTTRAAQGHTLERCAVTLSYLKHSVAVGCRTVHGLSGLTCLSAYATKNQKYLVQNGSYVLRTGTWRFACVRQSRGHPAHGEQS